MGTIKTLVDFLETLEQRKIYYKLNKVRNGILVEIAVPGQRWEIEFMANGSIEIEKFISDGTIFDYSEIDVLLKKFSD